MKLKEMLKKINWKHFISYLFVGGAATLVEWLFFWLFEGVLHIQYLVATVLAIVISTFSNWLFGRLWTFKDSQKGNVLLEIGKIYVASIVGLLLNLLIMWALVDGIHLHEMLSKIIATGIVFLYNYLVRIWVIYRKKK